MSEISNMLDSGDLRVLAVLSDQPILDYEDLPTAEAQGLDVVAVNWRGSYIPGDAGDEAFERWEGTLLALVESKL